MISVLMSVFNEPKRWLVESIDSVLNQTYQDLEFIIVVDNPLADKEIVECLNDYSSSDKRIIVIFNKRNLGLALSLNEGLRLAKGEFIARMDADDVAMPSRFENELVFLINQNADMVSTNGIIIDENSCYVRKMEEKKLDPSRDLLFQNPILHPSVLIKTSVMRQLGGYRNFRRSQDYDLWLRMLSCGFKIRVLNDYLIKYRISSFNLSNSNRLEQYYTNLFQRKMYRKRIKSGTDGFTEDGFKKYLSSKRINERKNERCKRCFNYLEKAKESKKKNLSFFVLVIKAFFAFPSIFLQSLRDNISRRKYC